LLNTDDNELIEFAAPRNLHLNTRPQNDRLIMAATAGILPYLTNYGRTDEERALFLTRLADANLVKAKTAEAQRLAKASLALRDSPDARRVLSSPPPPPAEPTGEEE
jgi:hypothetical protein